MILADFVFYKSYPTPLPPSRPIDKVAESQRWSLLLPHPSYPLTKAPLLYCSQEVFLKHSHGHANSLIKNP